MTSAPAHDQPYKPTVRLASRGHLTTFLMDLAAEIGADCYMLLAILHDQEKTSARIVASNWIHDAIELTGHRLIASIAEAPAVAPGTKAEGILPGMAPSMPGVLTGEQARLLDILGHCEIFSLKINVGRQRYFLLLSSAQIGQIDQHRLTSAQMKCCYALSQAPGMLAAAVELAPLSEREHECLSWVSEGKTTEEIAVIVGVSANTVNSYITNAIQKFSASNRTMAIATAIRSGVV